MNRKVYKQIVQWNEGGNPQPLILNGARQVGKTWLMKEFARNVYPGDFVYINFEDEPQLVNVFVQDFNIRRIEDTISIVTGVDIKETTLLLFDEIQSAPRGVMALKYFAEKTPSRRIIAAGSMLGISLHSGDSFPVGKVDILDVYPLDFQEFLWAMGEDKLSQAIAQCQWDLLNIVKEKAEGLLRLYYYVGGMPGVVKGYVVDHNVANVRKKQLALLNSYQFDFSKHAPASEVPRIRMVWESLPSQLSKENRKFIYGAVREGSRAKDFEIAIEWLMNAGLIYKVCRINNAQLPLSAYADLDVFKIFVLDVGLLGAMSNLSAQSLVDVNEIFMQYRGAMTEQYVYQQILQWEDHKVYYWSANNSRGEVDFVVDNGDCIIPIEVKAAENLQSKSLKAFCDKYHIPHALRLSLSNYRQQDWLTNIPLYAIQSLPAVPLEP